MSSGMLWKQVKKQPTQPKTAVLEKLPYKKPTIRTEKMTVVAALCNGSPGLGRKAFSGAPDFCAPNKLKSWDHKISSP